MEITEHFLGMNTTHGYITDNMTLETNNDLNNRPWKPTEYKTSCPFKMGSLANDSCSSACAFCSEGVCCIGTKQETQTEGKSCPFTGFRTKCTQKCALFSDNGCLMTCKGH